MVNIISNLVIEGIHWCLFPGSLYSMWPWRLWMFAAPSTDVWFPTQAPQISSTKRWRKALLHVVDATPLSTPEEHTAICWLWRPRLTGSCGSLGMAWARMTEKSWGLVDFIRRFCWPFKKYSGVMLKKWVGRATPRFSMAIIALDWNTCAFFESLPLKPWKTGHDETMRAFSRKSSLY